MTRGVSRQALRAFLDHPDRARRAFLDHPDRARRAFLDHPERARRAFLDHQRLGWSRRSRSDRLETW
ncbi:hypothetical protein [Nocardioides aequoreus]|uniref:hypothetical protein n=1 Tax=Nocardioides aequoreus TaxID=397278 RepID=UPI0004C3DFE4|nr:hypothetical protein [Nocardioides aequoreus]